MKHKCYYCDKEVDNSNGYFCGAIVAWICFECDDWQSYWAYVEQSDSKKNPSQRESSPKMNNNTAGK